MFGFSESDASPSNVMFLSSGQNIYLSRAVGGVQGDANCVGNEASDKMYVHVCEYASLFAEWHVLEEVNQAEQRLKSPKLTAWDMGHILGSTGIVLLMLVCLESESFYPFCMRNPSMVMLRNVNFYKNQATSDYFHFLKYL